MDPDDQNQKITSAKKQRERIPEQPFESLPNLTNLSFQITLHLLTQQWDKAIHLFSSMSQHPNFKSWESREKMIDEMVTCYMRKGAEHFHKGEPLLQLACYEKALEIEGIEAISKARLHANSGWTSFQLKQYERAATHCLKAEECASLDDITKVIGQSASTMFYTIYNKMALETYYDNPQESLKYFQRIVKLQGILPLEKAVAYAQIAGQCEGLHLSEQVLEPALEALLIPELSSQPLLYNKTLCLASAECFTKEDFEESLRYFKKITSFEGFLPHEKQILCMNAGHCYSMLKKWDDAVSHYQKAIALIPKDEPGNVLISFQLARCYGELGQLDKQKKTYQDIQILIPKIKYTESPEEYREEVKSIQKLILLFVLNEHIKEREEEFEKKKKEKQEAKIKSEEDKKRTHQKKIEVIKVLQQASREQEEKVHLDKVSLEQEQRKEVERAKEEDKPHRTGSQEQKSSGPFVETEVDSSPIQPSQPKQKTKTKGTANPSSPPVVSESKSEVIPQKHQLDKVLKLGTTSYTILEKIRDEEWRFTRTEYLKYLEDVGCKIRSKGSHLMAQLPNRLLVEFQTDEGLQEETVFLDTNVLSFGSATLPPWEGEHVPYYMRGQIRTLQNKIEHIVKKAIEVKGELSNS